MIAADIKRSDLHGTSVGQEREKPLIAAGFDFGSDDWFLPEYAPKYDGDVKRIHIGFSGIHSPAVKLLAKQYAAWRLGRVKPVTVCMELRCRVSWWVRYLESRAISDPRLFGAQHMKRFGLWLQNKGLKVGAAQCIMRTIAQLIETGQRLGWQVTKEPLEACFGWHLVSGEDKGCAAPIPDEIYRKILWHALYDEKDIITKAGILIQSQTGLRISEVLSLREDCLLEDENGGFLLRYESKKTQKAEPVMRFIPANTLVCNAVEELAKETEPLRGESGRRELFLVKNHGIRPASAANWNRGRLRGFLRRWGITADDGREYPLHSHQFRASYVRRMLLAGTGIETIGQRFGHATAEMTAQYVHFQPEDLTMFLAPYIGGKGGNGID